MVVVHFVTWSISRPLTLYYTDSEKTDYPAMKRSGDKSGIPLSAARPLRNRESQILFIYLGQYSDVCFSAIKWRNSYYF